MIDNNILFNNREDHIRNEGNSEAFNSQINLKLVQIRVFNFTQTRMNNSSVIIIFITDIVLIESLQNYFMLKKTETHDSRVKNK